MPANIDRFKKDLSRLASEAVKLQNAMTREVRGAEVFDKAVFREIGEDKGKELIKALPKFSDSYDGWYSECLALLKQLLPDRVDDFRSFYEKPKNRKSISYGNYVIQDYLQNLRVTFGSEVRVDPSAAAPQLSQQVAILNAAERRFESSLFEIKQIVQYDLYDSEVEAARTLLKNGFLRAAGAISGVVIEKHLRQVCEDHSIPVSKKNPGIGDLNELLKSKNVIDVPAWRHITFLADIRNICDHSKSKEPTKEQVGDLIDGTSKVLKTVS